MCMNEMLQSLLRASLVRQDDTLYAIQIRSLILVSLPLLPGNALTTYGTNDIDSGGDDVVKYRLWDESTGWSAESPLGELLLKDQQSAGMTLIPYSTRGSDDIVLMVEDLNGKLYTGLWEGITGFASLTIGSEIDSMNSASLRNWKFLWDIPITKGTAFYSRDGTPEYLDWNGESLLGKEE